MAFSVLLTQPRRDSSALLRGRRRWSFYRWTLGSLSSEYRLQPLVVLHGGNVLKVLLTRLRVMLLGVCHHKFDGYGPQRNDFPALKPDAHQLAIGLDFAVVQARRTEAFPAIVKQILKHRPQVSGFERERFWILLRKAEFLRKLCLGEVDYFLAKAGIKRVRSVIATLI